LHFPAATSLIYFPMNRAWHFLTLFLVLALAGCESTGGFSERFRPAEPELRSFGQPVEQVFAAARNALQLMGFKVTRASEASGRIEAVNAVRADAALRSSSQVSVKVSLESTLDGGTDMRVWMTEVVEDSFTGAGGYGTRTPLRASPLYEVLFRETGNGLGLTEND
jgi:hypothetical protein